MSDPNSERIGKALRKHVRIEVRLGLRFVIEGDPSHTIYEALTQNISRGGVCFMAHEGKDQLIAAAAGNMPRLKVSLYIGAGDLPVDIQAQTAWISSNVGWFMTPENAEMPLIAGMAFENLSVEDAEKIDIFIEELLFKDRESVLEQEGRILSQFGSQQGIPAPPRGQRHG